MDSTTRIVISMIVIYGALALGYALRRARPEKAERSPAILRWCLLFLDCPLMVVVFWLLSPDHRAGAWKLPVIGFILSLLLIPLGIAVARLLRMERAEEGTFACGSSMSNIGMTYGGLLCLMILGIDGATLSQVYALYMIPFTFVVMFQIASWYSRNARPVGETMTAGFLRDPTRWVPIAGMALGIAMNFLVPRPGAWVEGIVTVWVLLSTGIYCLAIGLSMRFTAVRRYLKPALALCAVKFVATPLLALAVMQLFELTTFQRQVVLIESAMPMAIFAVVIVGLAGLARDLANSCWIVTTLGALPVVAPLYWVVTRMS